MATCSYCGSFILFGGERLGGLRYCNATCRDNGTLLAIAGQLPDDLVRQHVQEIHRGLCPKCRSSGPIDVHTAYRVWSALLVTSWRNIPEICCRSCGIKSQLQGIVYSLVLGWWGFPWGLVMTPVQIVRNIVGLAGPPDPLVASAALDRLVRVHLAATLGQPPDIRPVAP
ncbi:MAG: hypothetical protein AB1646_12440 [Thermodesulfobacteriota bacterium]